jgi:hypothetical protein
MRMFRHLHDPLGDNARLGLVSRLGATDSRHPAPSTTLMLQEGGASAPRAPVMRARHAPSILPKDFL